MFAPRGEIAPQKKHIDLTLRKNLTPRSSESGFHRNLKLPHLKRLSGSVRPYLKRGKVAPPGGQERPKVAPLTFYGVGRPMK